MAKLNISFQGKQYGIEKSVLDGAISNIQSQLFKLSAGSVEETLEGDGAEYYTLAPSTLSFRSTAPLDELQEVQVNGRTVDPSNYTLEEGSTVVTFNIDYLKQLNDGDYEVAVLSEKQSSKGGFTVASPKVSQYGFYYNQPYNGYVDAFGDYIIFFFRENGTVDVVFLYGGITMNCTYTADIGSFVITDPDGIQYNGMVVDENPMELYCFELGNTFTLGNGTVFADDDYLYVYTEDFGTYLPTVFDRTKRQYKPVKSNINGMDITSLTSTYSECSNLIVAPQIPNTVKELDSTFWNCSSLVSAVIPSTVEYMLAYTFMNCTNLKKLTIGKGLFYNTTRYQFDNCISLEEIIVEDGNEYWFTDESGVLYGWDEKKTYFTLYAIPCGKLKNITLLENTEDIGQRYVWNEIEALTIPSKNMFTPFSSEILKGLKAVYVPADLLDEYKSDPVWEGYNIYPIPNE